MEERVAVGWAPHKKWLQDNKPFFVAVVYWRRHDRDAAAIQHDMRQIRATGFSAVRLLFHRVNDLEQASGELDWAPADIAFDAAQAAGLWVLPAFNATPPLSAQRRLGLTEPRDLEELKRRRSHPALEADAREFLRRAIERYRSHPALLAWHAVGEPPSFAGDAIAAEDQGRLIVWLKERYGTLEAVNDAWLREGGPLWIEGLPLTSWEEAADAIVRPDWRNFRRRRDLLRFQTDGALERIQESVALYRELDPHHPIRSGGHQLFANHAAYRWDLEAQAAQADFFYSSIHPSWHFNLVEGEVVRPVAVQCRLIACFAGQCGTGTSGRGWYGSQESTGGPAIMSGHLPFNATPGQLTQLMLTYLGAGFRGIGFWCWNVRPGGQEAGEYGLTDVAGRITGRAQTAGQIARHIEHRRQELWDAQPEPHVGVLYCWDNEAIAVREARLQPHFETDPSRARIGAGRALLNHNIPFTYVTARQLLDGALLPSIKVLFLPYLRVLPRPVLAALQRFADAGGRVVADTPCAYLDEYGHLFEEGLRGPVAHLFGAYAGNLYHTAGQTAPVRVIPGGETSRQHGASRPVAVEGQFADLVPQEGTSKYLFDDGRPACVERRHGSGSAALLGWSASLQCFAPGATAMEALLASTIVPGLADSTPWRWRLAPAADDSEPHDDADLSDEPLAPAQVLTYRLAGEAADHYFLVNDGPRRRVQLTGTQPGRVEDVLAGHTLATPPGFSQSVEIEVPADSGIWLRWTPVPAGSPE